MRKIYWLTIVLAIVLSFAVKTDALEPARLSELSDDDCVAFLESNNIEIPETYDDSMSWMPFIHAIIEIVENEPTAEFAFGYGVALEFAYEIKTAVNAYYGIDNIATLSTRSSEILRDNTVHGSWLPEYDGFNCYAYAIDYYEYGRETTPGIFDWIKHDGNPKENFRYNWLANAYTVAGWVVDDLVALGYTVTNFSDTLPATDVADHTHLICVRTDLDGELLYGYRDFHFMKFGKDGYWYHKPGRTNPLRYKYTPSNDRIWVAESYNGATNTYSRTEEFTYDSEIWFIEYTTPHVWEYVFWESGQHIERCTICGEERLADCQWGSAAYVGLNCHQFTCELCGGLGGNTACTRAYSHMYDETSGNHAHIEACTVCNYTGNLPENCTITVTGNGDGTHTTACAVCGFSEVADCDYQCTYTGDGSTHTHTTTCSGCDHSETESCTFAIRYNGYVDGHNTHINACTECGNSPFDAVQCTYNSSGKCRFCGTFENYVPINREKEELLKE